MKVKIKLSRNHPDQAMQFGAHIVTPTFQEIELNDVEIKSLDTVGIKYWFNIEKLEEEIKTVKEKRIRRTKKQMEEGMK